MAADTERLIPAGIMRSDVAGREVFHAWPPSCRYRSPLPGKEPDPTPSRTVSAPSTGAVPANSAARANFLRSTALGVDGSSMREGRLFSQRSRAAEFSSQASRSVT